MSSESISKRELSAFYIYDDKIELKVTSDDEGASGVQLDRIYTVGRMFSRGVY